MAERVNPLEEVLLRPPEQRLGEYKYRCAQSIVFGVPVLALQWFGGSLGGPEAPRWVAILQALLAGWVMYVGAAGMLVEGAIVWQRRRGVQPDLIVAVTAIAMYFASLVAAVYLVVSGRGLLSFFHLPVMLVALWSGARWFHLHRSPIG